MIDLSIEVARKVARNRAKESGLNLITPEDSSAIKSAAQLVVTASTPLSLPEVRKRISVYVPRIVGDVESLLPDFVVDAIGPRAPFVLIGGDGWDDPAALAGLISHELGHHLRDEAARNAAGIIGSLAWDFGYLVHPLIRLSDESTCYTCDVCSAVILRGEAPKVVADRALTSLRTIYAADSSSFRIARGVMASTVASLGRLQLPGIRTPLQRTLQELRGEGVDFGQWNAAVGEVSP